MKEKHVHRNAEIRRMREQGVGPREIARRLGVTPNLVAGVLFRAGMTEPTQGRGNGATEEVRRRAVELSWQTTLREAARCYGVSIATIAAWRQRPDAA